MDNYTERVRRRAYLIWLDEGRPAGREAAHWHMASELVAKEEHHKASTKPARGSSRSKRVSGSRAGSAALVASMGEAPARTSIGAPVRPPAGAATRDAIAVNPATARTTAAKAPADKLVKPAAAAAAATGDEIKSSPKIVSNKSKSKPRGKR